MCESQRIEVERRLRLDQLLVQVCPALRRADVQQMIAEGAVFINAQPALKPGQYVEPGDVVEAQFPALEEADAAPPLPLALSPEIMLEDAQLLVVNKPAGMPTHAGGGEQGIALAHYLAERYPDLAHVGGVERAGIVQRMDVALSGLLLVARDADTYKVLKHAAKNQQVEMRYSVLVEGHLTGADVIRAPLSNDKRRRHRLVVTRRGRPAVTRYRALRQYRVEDRPYTLLDVQPQTARRHQMRVHLAWYGYPVVGDTLYGSSRQSVLSDRLFMHLGQVIFSHPVTEERLQVEAELPEALASILRFMARPRWMR